MIAWLVVISATAARYYMRKAARDRHVDNIIATHTHTSNAYLRGTRRVGTACWLQSGTCRSHRWTQQAVSSSGAQSHQCLSVACCRAADGSLERYVTLQQFHTTWDYVLVHQAMSIPCWLGSVTVRTLDLRPRGRGFDSRSGRYQVVSTWMGDCLRTSKPSQYITNTKVNSAFHTSGVGKSSTPTSLHG